MADTGKDRASTAMKLTDKERAELLTHICQRIQEGWLPHLQRDRSFAWGQPSVPDGFGWWTLGASIMRRVEPMTDREAAAWKTTLSPELVAWLGENDRDDS